MSNLFVWSFLNMSTLSTLTQPTNFPEGAPAVGIWFCGHFIEPSLRPSGDLARWSKSVWSPSNDNSLLPLPFLEFHGTQLNFLRHAALKYGFEHPGEVFRHLVFVANVIEPNETKKVIFRKIRCLHCGVGKPKDSTDKVKLVDDEVIQVYGFQGERVKRAASEASSHN